MPETTYRPRYACHTCAAFAASGESSRLRIAAGRPRRAIKEA